ncbi:MAG: cobalamin-dependent protein, partial [Candidatus Omnitrophica bacterium]|nr:cobalamin-dependent protein [Candidatus Omnitrophota bacterium]
MKVLLVNPSFDYRKFGRFGRFMEPMPCLGLAYIAAVLEQNDIDVEVIDDFVLKIGPSGIADFVKKNKFDIVGISCLTPSAPEVFSIAAAIKKYSGKTLIVLGNIHANVFAEEILRNEAVDIIVYGEGEYAMLELTRAAAESKDFSQVKGICFKREGAIVKTAPRAMIENLDSLPFPAWRLFPFKNYTFLSFIDVKKPGLSILGSRGCP